MSMQYKRCHNRSIVETELDEVITGEQKENLIRILKEKLCGASKNILSVKNVQILEDGCIEFTCKTLWDDGNTWDDSKIIIDPDDERTQGVCLRGMTSIYVGDARVYDDGRCIYGDGIQENIVENEKDDERYYFSLCGSGTDENGEEYEDYFIFDTKYKLPYEKQSYPGIMF